VAQPLRPMPAARMIAVLRSERTRMMSLREDTRS
jgi:hypothetical protein